jgi:ABC-type Fe3+-siderophore transport system permease subunit
MTQRRLQLAAPHAGEIAINQARAMRVATLLVAGGLMMAAFLVGRRIASPYRRLH